MVGTKVGPRILQSRETNQDNEAFFLISPLYIQDVNINKSHPSASRQCSSCCSPQPPQLSHEGSFKTFLSFETLPQVWRTLLGGQLEFLLGNYGSQQSLSYLYYHHRFLETQCLGEGLVLPKALGP